MHEKGGEVILVINTIAIIVKINRQFILINSIMISMQGLRAAHLERDGGGRGALHLRGQFQPRPPVLPPAQGALS